MILAGAEAILIRGSTLTHQHHIKHFKVMISTFVQIEFFICKQLSLRTSINATCGSRFNKERF